MEILKYCKQLKKKQIAESIYNYIKLLKKIENRKDPLKYGKMLKASFFSFV